MPELPESVKKWVESHPSHFCGECNRFKYEDIDGNGYCEMLDLLPRCDTPSCGFFFKPIPSNN